MAAPLPPVLQVTREQAQALAKGDPRLQGQLELLFSLTRFTGIGQAQIDDDVVLDADGVTFAVGLPVGRFFVDLVVMVDVVGGGGGVDGWIVTDASEADLSAGSYAIFVAGPFGSGGGASARPGPYGLVDVTACYTLRGFVEVQTQGVLGFTVAQTGAPTSATLLAGSGLTITQQRVSP